MGCRRHRHRLVAVVRLTPDLLPDFIKKERDVRVTHMFPDDWPESEVDDHRFDDCPCAPEMRQFFEGRGYHWRVDHRRIPKTEEFPL